MIKYFTYSISIAFISWIVGMIINAVLTKKAFYNKNLSNLSFIKNETLNKAIGLEIFKWIVKNTFFKFFNQKLTLKKKIEIIDLKNLRNEMTISEISHLIGFGFMGIFALVKVFHANYLFALVMMIVNILMNLYPSLLQQENKRRIDKLIKRFLPTTNLN
ncbi:hypothetical protein EZ449_18800 [Pedobacter frigidisoli]|uniref:Glycosyl-4,4'-diaponeurosporenoate acyltransferase n=1 Tax=Pedobacter frigidisoli TaxID=2530455 RepID=A0A4R0NMK9_9SPHI|nr:hypothetical protein [Pedobacter frigidisoli]TCD02112.1 hypothetical protein EZ449_18800 [Pedobacter frigidisoli]